MALQPIFCSSCGLEIQLYERLIPYKKNVYHDDPYPCYPYDKKDRD